MSVNLGLVVHQHRPEVVDLAREALEWCGAHGITPSMPEPDAALVGRSDLAVAAATFGASLDLILSLGGDGTMLRAVQFAAHHDVPIIGVNAGQLGYLTEVDPSQMGAVLEAWHADELVVEERMLLRIDFEGVDHPPEYALNEVVLERADPGHIVAVEAGIGGQHFTNYMADGVIVGTPTGSTAYSMSAGGPIVEPNFEGLLLTPVAPHNLFDRSLVLKPSTPVQLTVSGYRNGVITVDGRQILELEPGQSVLCRAAERRVRMLTRGERNFHSILKDKFGLTDR